jgi:hypothetical protein
VEREEGRESEGKEERFRGMEREEGGMDIDLLYDPETKHDSILSSLRARQWRQVERGEEGDNHREENESHSQSDTKVWIDNGAWLRRRQLRNRRMC